MRGMGDKNYRRHFRLNNLRFLGLLLVVAVVCVYVGSSLGPAPHRYDRFTTPPARAQKFVVPATMADQSVPSNNLVDAPALHSVPLSSSPSRPPLPSLLLNSGSGPRTAVLGMARKIDLPSAYRFVRSLRTHTPATDIILFTDQESLTAPLKAMYDMFQVKVVLFDVARDLPANMASFHPSSYRWVLMRDYLRQSAKEGGSVSKPYDLLLFSDVRDVVFQRDIFAAMQRAEGNGHGFYAFQEQRPATIAQCGWNSGWVRDCFGDEGLQKVGHNVISCSGTSMASWDDGVAYVELLGALTEPFCVSSLFFPIVSSFVLLFVMWLIFCLCLMPCSPNTRDQTAMRAQWHRSGTAQLLSLQRGLGLESECSSHYFERRRLHHHRAVYAQSDSRPCWPRAQYAG